MHMIEVINALRRIQRTLLQNLGCEPTPDELTTQMDITPDKVQGARSGGPAGRCALWTICGPRHQRRQRPRAT